MNSPHRIAPCFIIFLIVALLLPSTVHAANPQSGANSAAVAPTKMIVFIGTYTRGKSKGIYSGELDLATGKLSITGVTPSVEPSFLAIDPTRRFLYAVNEVEQWGGMKNAGGVSAFAIDPT